MLEGCWARARRKVTRGFPPLGMASGAWALLRAFFHRVAPGIGSTRDVSGGLAESIARRARRGSAAWRLTEKGLLSVTSLTCSPNRHATLGKVLKAYPVTVKAFTRCSSNLVLVGSAYFSGHS